MVVTTFTGPSVGRGFKGHGRAVKGCPTDRVAVYPPKDDSMARIKSWANDVVPVLLRAAAGVAESADPVYRVILHNGEPPGSAAGHFDATRTRDA